MTLPFLIKISVRPWTKCSIEEFRDLDKFCHRPAGAIAGPAKGFYRFHFCLSVGYLPRAQRASAIIIKGPASLPPFVSAHHEEKPCQSHSCRQYYTSNLYHQTNHKGSMLLQNPCPVYIWLHPKVTESQANTIR